MRQHVVDLAGDPGALAEDVGLAAGGQQLLGLRQQGSLLPAVQAKPAATAITPRITGIARAR